MNWRWIVLLFLFLLLFIFTLQNTGEIRVQFLFWSFSTSRVIIIFSSILAGFAMGLIFSYWKNKDF